MQLTGQPSKSSTNPDVPQVASVLWHSLNAAPPMLEEGLCFTGNIFNVMPELSKGMCLAAVSFLSITVLFAHLLSFYA